MTHPATCRSWSDRHIVNRADLKRRVADYTFRTISWGQNHVPPGLRSLIGVLFMAGGILGFLPILGFWMFPLGVAFVALDVPPARRHIESWMKHLYRTAYLDGAPSRDGTPSAGKVDPSEGPTSK